MHLPEIHPNAILLSTRTHSKLIQLKILICLKESLPSWTFVTNELEHSTRRERNATIYEAYSAWAAGSLYGSWQGKRGCKFTTAFGARWTFPVFPVVSGQRNSALRKTVVADIIVVDIAVVNIVTTAFAEQWHTSRD